MKVVLSVIYILFFGCCKPAPVVPGSLVGDAGPVTSVAACARLEALGCPEGKPAKSGASCSDIVDRVNASGYNHVDLACVVKAQSVTDVVKCEGVRCLP